MNTVDLGKLFQDLFVLATVIAVPTEAFKTILYKVAGKTDITLVLVKLFALTLGIAFCIEYDLDITDIISGQNLILGQILTGAISAEGTGTLHDLIKNKLPNAMSQSMDATETFVKTYDETKKFLNELSIEELGGIVNDVMIETGVLNNSEVTNLNDSKILYQDYPVELPDIEV
jgi:hypothetical protein